MLKSSVIKFARFSGWLWMVDPVFVDAYLASPVEKAQTLGFGSSPSDTYAAIAKRFLDVVGSFAMLAVLAPTMLMVALFIKLDSEGPVFFSQERIGYKGRKFRLYKFRTMHLDAGKTMAEVRQLPNDRGPVFKLEFDPRITRIGRFLRRTSIDELPQLLNVLSGDMSLVGPRPLPMWFYEKLQAQGIASSFYERLSVRPGMTGLRQFSRSLFSFNTLVQSHRQYEEAIAFKLESEAQTQQIREIHERIKFFDELKRSNAMPMWDVTGAIHFVRVPADFDWDGLQHRILGSSELPRLVDLVFAEDSKEADPKEDSKEARSSHNRR